VNAKVGLDRAIRTGGWAIPARSQQTPPAGMLPRKFYSVLNGRGDQVGFISNSQERPALGTGEPTYYLKRSHKPAA